MNGHMITVSGALQSGGVSIVSHVSHESQAEPIFVRLEPGVTVAQFFKLVQGPAGADPNYLDGYASIVVDAFAHRQPWCRDTRAPHIAGPHPAAAAR